MSRQKLLLVDNDHGNLEILGKTLIDSGYEVLTADSADKALRISDAERPNLVILDTQLTKSADIDLTDELLKSATPFIFLCNHEKITQINQENNPGSLGVLERSDDINKMMPGIESALACAEKIRRLRENERRYSNAIQTGRVVDVAVGILMERHHIERDKAFEMLRKKARSERRKLRDIAQEILDAQQKLNQLSP
ncbi:MAG: ANTAR domain-containing protein [Candidatus Thiodiazotropha sp. (ex Epidulcina cf. delphinae)]|nr:ANTAR domain-containing protein [Candidatus Thiodiazotropha sp. (ex Epidulcina cf. delphinae)]